MRRVFASLRLQSDALHQPFVLGLHVEQGLRLRHRSDHRARLAAAERGQPLQIQIERAALDAAEHQGDFLRDHIVDVADEAQRQMIIFRIDPARARQTAAQHAERLSDIGGNFDTGEETRHGELPIHDAARRAHGGDQLLDPRQDTRHDHVDAGGIRVQAIALVQLGVGGHPVEEERIKDDRMSRGKRRIDGVEAPHIIGAHVARRLHAGEQDENMPVARVCVRMPSSAALVTFGSMPRSASLAPSSRITASVPSGTDQSRRPSPPEAVSPDTPALVTLDGDAFGLQRLRQLGGKRGVRRQAIAGAERIAQHDDLHRPLGGARRTPAARTNQREQRQRRKALDPAGFCPICAGS